MYPKWPCILMFTGETARKHIQTGNTSTQSRAPGLQVQNAVPVQIELLKNLPEPRSPRSHANIHRSIHTSRGLHTVHTLSTWHTRVRYITIQHIILHCIPLHSITIHIQYRTVQYITSFFMALHSYTHTFIHPYIRIFIHSYLHRFVFSHVHTFIDS